MPFTLLRGDITKVKADAIVNAANSGLLEGGGVCGAIFAEAGSAALAAECARVGHCDTGSAVITSACGLKNAAYIIHAVGPVWHGGGHDEEKLLRGCYASALELAEKNGCESIAFPLISSGIYGYPKGEAYDIAVSEIRRFLQTHELDVKLVLFDGSRPAASADWYRELRRFLSETDELVEQSAAACVQMSSEDEPDELSVWSEDDAAEACCSVEPEPIDLRELLPEADAVPVAEPEAPSAAKKSKKPEADSSSAKNADARLHFSRGYLEDYPVPSRKRILREKGVSKQACNAYKKIIAPGERHESRPLPASASLPDFLREPAETFQQALLRMIDERGLSDPEVYKRANVDRKMFSKIRKNPDYQPKKETALAFAIALHLDVFDTEDFLKKAGYAFSQSKADRIVEFFIRRNQFDIITINQALFDYDQKQLPA